LVHYFQWALQDITQTPQSLPAHQEFTTVVAAVALEFLLAVFSILFFSHSYCKLSSFVHWEEKK